MEHLDKIQELEARIENIELYLESYEKEDDEWQDHQADAQLDALEGEHAL